jgi:nicotinamidase-related amidase
VFWPEQSGVEFQDAFIPQTGEQLVQKRVPDAFCGTSLEASLREAGIRQVVLVGVATHNSVEATARSAGNLGFETWVIEDACYTFDKPDFFGQMHSAEAVHAMSLGNLHGEYATVISSETLLP